MKKSKTILYILFFIFLNTINCKNTNIIESLNQLIKKYHFHIGAVIGSESCTDAISQNKNIKKLYSIKTYNTIDNNFLDFVYVEDYNPSEIDKIINIYIKKIKRGGILIFKSNSNTKYLTDVLYNICDDENFKAITNKNIFGIRKQHKLTFIIPCYNRAHTIKRAIDSIYKQDLDFPFEVVCTDDASTDNTKNILLKYEKKYENFKAVFHEKNQGASEARNTCVAHSDGDLIFNLDSDNYLEPNSVGQLIDLLDISGCDIAAFGEVRYFNGNNKRFNSRKFKEPIIDLYNTWKNQNFFIIGSGNYLFTRKMYNLAGKYSGRVLETTTFGFKKLAKGAKITILQTKEKNFYWHSISSDSKWKQNERLKKNDNACLEELKNHQELFSDETNKKLKSYNVKKRKIFNDLQNDTFKLINKEALTHLFTGYWYENNKMYEEAINAYKMAIEMGCSNKKIYKKIQELEEKDFSSKK